MPQGPVSGACTRSPSRHALALVHLHGHAHTHTHTRMHARTHIQLHTLPHTQAGARVGATQARAGRCHAGRYPSKRACMHTYMCVHMCTHVHSCVWAGREPILQWREGLSDGGHDIMVYEVQSRSIDPQRPEHAESLAGGGWTPLQVPLNTCHHTCIRATHHNRMQCMHAHVCTVTAHAGGWCCIAAEPQRPDAALAPVAKAKGRPLVCTQACIHAYTNAHMNALIDRYQLRVRAVTAFGAGSFGEMLDPLFVPGTLPDAPAGTSAPSHAHACTCTHVCACARLHTHTHTHAHPRTHTMSGQLCVQSKHRMAALL